MPKLLYLLRTAGCSDNPLLATFDNILRSDLSSIVNVGLSDIQWLQASLPVRHGGLHADTVLQSMPLLLDHWLKVMVAQDKTPKRGVDHWGWEVLTP